MMNGQRHNDYLQQTYRRRNHDRQCTYVCFARAGLQELHVAARKYLCRLRSHRHTRHDAKFDGRDRFLAAGKGLTHTHTWAGNEHLI